MRRISGHAIVFPLPPSSPTSRSPSRGSFRLRSAGKSLGFAGGAAEPTARPLRVARAELQQPRPHARRLAVERHENHGLRLPVEGHAPPLRVAVAAASIARVAGVGDGLVTPEVAVARILLVALFGVNLTEGVAPDVVGVVAVRSSVVLRRVECRGARNTAQEVG